MKLIAYLQNKIWLSRRNITWLIDQDCIFVNWEKIESYKQDLIDGDELLINSVGLKFKEVYKMQDDRLDSKIIIFNKPIWYVVSKSDPNNETIYDILPKELNNYYYIWRLDKDSHWLLLLTNDPKLVNEYEHPKNEIEKEYIVEINKPLWQNDMKQCLKWVEESWEILKIKSIEKIEDYKVEKYKVILIEWKKRHIRRIFKSFWNHVIDLQRIREWKYKIWNLKTWEWELINLN
jgi:pseudouridine synthase